MPSYKKADLETFTIGNQLVGTDCQDTCHQILMKTIVVRIQHLLINTQTRTDIEERSYPCLRYKYGFFFLFLERITALLRKFKPWIQNLQVRLPTPMLQDQILFIFPKKSCYSSKEIQNSKFRNKMPQIFAKLVSKIFLFPKIATTLLKKFKIPSLEIKRYKTMLG